MIEVVDKCYLFDNSSEEFKLIAKIINNELSIKVESTELPNWFIKYVLSNYLIDDNDKAEEDQVIYNKSVNQVNRRDFYFMGLKLDDLEFASKVLRAMNHPLRQKILLLMNDKSPLTFYQINTKLNLEQSTASQHLAILGRSGVISVFKEGPNIYYKFNSEITKVISGAVNIIKEGFSDS
jgi:DNA-binding transcriptional ArsR family regulator